MRKDEFVVTWFPPDGDKTKKLKTEEAARTFIETHVSDSGWAVKEWNPILLIRTTIVSESEIPL